MNKRSGLKGKLFFNFYRAEQSLHIFNTTKEIPEHHIKAPPFH